MALSIKTGDITEANDNTVLRIEDGTGLYNATTNPGGWLDESESVPATQPKVSVVNGTTIHLYLDVVYTNSAGTSTIYDQIELYDEFGPFTDINDLIFDITPDLLVSSGTPMGASGDEMLDGWYDITYSFEDDGATYTDSTVTTSVLVDGKVRVKIYDQLRDIPYVNSYERFSNDFKEWTDILYPLYYFSLLEGMIAEVSSARKNEILDILGTLERLLN